MKTPLFCGRIVLIVPKIPVQNNIRTRVLLLSLAMHHQTRSPTILFLIEVIKEFVIEILISFENIRRKTIQT